MPDQRPVAVVTGSAIRVGRAIAGSLVDHGYRVWIHYRSSGDPATRAVAELGEAALGPLRADLSDETARTDLTRTIVDRSGPAGGRLDLLVNSAASFEDGDFLARTDADLRRVLEINLVAPMSLARGLAPALTESRGSIVNMVDVSAVEVWRGYVEHGVAKAGLSMATRALAVELAPVRVNAIAPGTVLWPEGQEWAEGSTARARTVARIPLGRVGSPADVAAAVRFFARATHVTGQVLAVDGGHSAAGGGHLRPHEEPDA